MGRFSGNLYFSLLSINVRFEFFFFKCTQMVFSVSVKRVIFIVVSTPFYGLSLFFFRIYI